VYATLLAHGSVGYQQMLERQITLARSIARFIVDSSDDFELLPSSDDSREDILSRIYIIVLFRAKDKRLNEELVQRIQATRKVYVSGTTWDGQPACRFAVSNWQVVPDRESAAVKNVLEYVVKEYSTEHSQV
jgi:glutamate/tyrosine decarboxylase-like PLP-dependent enzyme